MVAGYEYQVRSKDGGTQELAPRKGTVDFIRAAGGEIIPGTEEDVEPGQLTPEGRYDPLPLGPETTDLA